MTLSERGPHLVRGSGWGERRVLTPVALTQRERRGRAPHVAQEAACVRVMREGVYLFPTWSMKRRLPAFRDLLGLVASK